MPVSNFGSNPSLKQLVYEELKDNIIKGDYAQGERLAEESLSAQMNISRAPIREALNMLERDGFVTILPRKGAFVTEINREDLGYIYEIRLLMEPYAAKISVGHIPPDEIEEVRKLLEEVEKNPADMHLYTESDLYIHDLIVDHVENQYLSEILTNIKAHSLRLRWAAEYEGDTTQEEIVLEANREHMEIIDALTAQDEEHVCELVRMHLENAKKRLLSADNNQ